MKIQVLGSGCPTCKKLYEITQKAVNEMGLQEKVEYISGSEGTKAIIEMGMMSSPVLVVDGNPVMTGFTSDLEKIKRIISTGMKATMQTSKCACGGKC